MKIWTITTSQPDDGTATMVYTSEAEVDAHRARIIAASWESWFGEDKPMPENTDEAWGILTNQAGFFDTVDVTEHEIAASALPRPCGVDVPAACPFCGCTDINFHIQDDHLRWFECDWCQAVGPVEQPDADPPEGWNFRAQPSPDVAALVEAAVKAERDRIIDALRDEADVTPCDEDAVVVRDCADLVEVDFSYEDAERLKEARLKGGAA